MAKSVLDTARKYLQNKKFSEVIKLLEPRVLEYRDSFQFYYILGVACLYQGDVAGSETYFRSARHIKLNDVNLILAQAVIFLKRGKIDKAVEYGDTIKVSVRQGDILAGGEGIVDVGNGLSPRHADDGVPLCGAADVEGDHLAENVEQLVAVHALAAFQNAHAVDAEYGFELIFHIQVTLPGLIDLELHHAALAGLFDEAGNRGSRQKQPVRDFGLVHIGIVIQVGNDAHKLLFLMLFIHDFPPLRLSKGIRSGMLPPQRSCGLRSAGNRRMRR